DLWIVRVEQPVGVALGHGVRRGEVDHVECAARADVRDLRARDRVEPVLARGQDAAGDEVADLGGRDVEDAGEVTVVGEFLHRGAAGAGGVEDEAVVGVGQPVADGVDAGRGDPEHREPGGGPGIARRDRVGTRAGEGVGGVAEYLTRDAVEARDVGDRVQHRDVAGTDVGGDVARGHRRHHDLRYADGQCLQRGGDQRGAAGAAQADDAVEVALCGQEPGERGGHGGDGAAAVAGEHGAGAVGVPGGDLGCRDV